MATIYHITSRKEWKEAEKKGSYEAASLAAENFIHCCELQQMRSVLKRYFDGKKGLVALLLETEKLKHPVKYEASPSVNETFPHVYGPINIDAVEEVIDL
ncbi:MAG: DUF952 domain-containing protein [Chitinophagaceae bacterium]